MEIVQILGRERKKVYRLSTTLTDDLEELMRLQEQCRI